ncbi:DsbA family protein [Insolitispirillum peregrinum]|uniref:DsbA family protein n=1 Tax=Insolitispirillum peregrinum TaxID=80876 RepID=UPI0036061E08
MTSDKLTVLYLFDPLCGWCYGSLPKLHRLAAQPVVQISFLPTGLFCGEGARPMTPAFARFAWQNDLRVQAATGQPFSDAYQSGVLADETTPFDSMPLVLALLAVRQTAPADELKALTALQQARYVAGRANTTLPAVEAILAGHGFAAAVDLLRDDLPGLLKQARRSIEEGDAMMDSLRARGVPTFAILERGQPKLIDVDTLLERLER